MSKQIANESGIQNNVDSPKEKSVWSVWILKSLNMLQVYSNVVLALSAIASVFLTVGLVIHSSRSLSKANQLFNLQTRVAEIQLKQFIAENRPQIFPSVVNLNGPKLQDDHYLVRWKVANNGGGYIKDLVHTMALLVKDDQDSEHLDMIYLITFPGEPIKPNIHIFHHANVYDKASIEKMTEALDQERTLFLVMKAYYTIPAELTIAGVDTPEEASNVAVWSARSKTFVNSRGNETNQALIAIVEQEQQLLKLNGITLKK